jgi:glucose-6-phosphate isomerase
MTRIGFSSSFDHPLIPRDAVELFHEFGKQGRLGFMELPGNHDLLDASVEMASRAASMGNTMLVCGIGGSSLGLRALLSALGNPSGRSVHVLESPDTRLLKRVTDTCDPRDTTLAVITKSGGTSETLSLFMKLHPWMGSDSRVFAVTDPGRGDLRRLATDRGFHTLPVPPAVGGRYSVLSPVGLFPAAYAGIDVKAVLRGACEVGDDFLENGQNSLAGQVAAACFNHFHTHPVHVFMPYTDLLYDTALWFAQLWAESLGKARNLDGTPTCTGQTPLACRGPSDQHSLVQLFMEGPMDKVFTIVGETPPDKGSVVPGPYSEYPSMSFLEGRSPDELRSAEEEATASALTERGLPVCRLSIPGVSAEVMGAVFMLYQIATVLTGLALDVDPLDQPGVERGKILTFRAMGRAGF